MKPALLVATTGWDVESWARRIRPLLPAHPVLRTDRQGVFAGSDAELAGGPLRARMEAAAGAVRPAAGAPRHLLARGGRRSHLLAGAAAGRAGRAHRGPRPDGAHDRIRRLAGAASPAPRRDLRAPPARAALARVRPAGREARDRRADGARRDGTRCRGGSAPPRLPRARLVTLGEEPAGRGGLSRRRRARRVPRRHRYPRRAAPPHAGNARHPRQAGPAENCGATGRSAGRSSSMPGAAAARSRATSRRRSATARSSAPAWTCSRGSRCRPTALSGRSRT